RLAGSEGECLSRLRARRLRGRAFRSHAVQGVVMPELDGRVALVTGAGRNIGRAIALDLAAGGAAVVVNARSNQAEADGVVAEIAKSGGKAMAFLADVADAGAVGRMTQAALEHFGRLDILVNNAALR